MKIPKKETFRRNVTSTEEFTFTYNFLSYSHTIDIDNMIYPPNKINLLINSRNMSILAKLLVKIIDLRDRPRLPIATVLVLLFELNRLRLIISVVRVIIAAT